MALLWARRRKKIVEKLTTLPVEDIFYLDESGFNLEMKKEHRWAFKNARLLAEKSEKRKIIFVIAVQNYQHQLLSAFCFSGSTNKERMN